MHSFEKYIKKISSKISKVEEYDDEKIKVIEYGLFAISQIITSLILVVLFGYIFNVLIESIIVSFAIAILRKNSGGVHASSPGICLFVGTTITIIIAVLLKYIVVSVDYKYIILVWIINLAIIYLKAPIDSKSKPIKSIKRKKELKQKSIKIILIFTCISMALLIIGLRFNKVNYLIYSWGITLGATWQVITLTRCGEVVLGNLDSFLYNLSVTRGKTYEKE